MVKGLPHIINNVLKATQLISISLGLPDSLVCGLSHKSKRKTSSEKEPVTFEWDRWGDYGSLWFTTRLDSNISGAILLFQCVDLSLFLKMKEMSEIRHGHCFLWYRVLWNVKSALPESSSMSKLSWFLSEWSVCPRHTTFVHMFSSLNCGFLGAGWCFLYSCVPGCCKNESIVCFLGATLMINRLNLLVAD